MMRGTLCENWKMANLNSFLADTLPAVTKLRVAGKMRRNVTSFSFLDKNDRTGTADQPIPSRRSLAIGLSAFALFGNAAAVGNSLAEDNGFWITGPIPVPHANNNINNEETGTRSFLKKGVYIAKIGTKGRMHRLKKSAFDLMAMADLIEQGDTLNYVRRFLRFKGTFMYFDFDEVISATPVEDREPLTNLANRLFDSFEKLISAVRMQDLARTKSCYQEITPILEEVMTRFA